MFLKFALTIQISVVLIKRDQEINGLLRQMVSIIKAILKVV